MKALLLAIFAISSLQAHFFYSEEMLQANLKNYTEEERVALDKDLALVREVCFPENLVSKQKPLYLATAGGPGSRKTTILERFLKSHLQYEDCIYLDPDPRTLKYMVHTYVGRSLSPLVIAEEDNYSTVIQKAYHKWRAGSLYISGTLLEEAFQHRCDVAHGTTLTGEIVPTLLKTLKKSGYEITLLLCSCEDDFRLKAIRYRNDEQRFYQSSPEDAVSKALLFPQRMETYFTYADRLYFYWSDNLNTPERLAAIYQNGILAISDDEAWSRFSEKYERDRAKLSTPVPSWPELLKLLNR